MARKLLILLFLLLSIIILIIGGINRTQAKLSKDANPAKQNQDNHVNNVQIDNNTTSKDSSFSQSDYDNYPIVTGSITAVSQKSIEITDEINSHYSLDGRAYHYALEQGFSPIKGLSIEFSIFLGDEMNFLWIKDLNQNQIYFLRSPNNQPLWSGNRK